MYLSNSSDTLHIAHSAIAQCTQVYVLTQDRPGPHAGAASLEKRPYQRDLQSIVHDLQLVFGT